MSIAADAAVLLDAPRTQLRRWLSAGAAIVVLHGVAIAGVLYLKGLQSADGPPPAPIMLTLAPVTASTSNIENDQALGPQMVKSEPEPEEVAPEEIVKAKDADIPKPLKRPKRERKPDPPAPVTSAPRAAPVLASMAAAPIAGVSADEADAIMDWQARLRAHLERYKRYPRNAQLRGEKGEAMLRFVVDREGNVISSALVRSSGFAVLDEETMAMIRRAEPLPEMPPEIAEMQKSFTIPVRFGIR